jgi:DNA-directed RNA polymerase subunit omega
VKPFPIEELVDRCGSRFAVVVAAAKRAKQIKEGAPPLISLPTRNPLTIALHEIAAGLVEITDEPVIVLEEPVAVTLVEETISELPNPEAVAELLGIAIVDGASDVPDDEVELDDEIAEELTDDLAEDLDDDDDEDDDDEGDEIDLDDDDDWEESEE